jgi:hypothetical protein
MQRISTLSNLPAFDFGQLGLGRFACRFARRLAFDATRFN